MVPLFLPYFSCSYTNAVYQRRKFCVARRGALMVLECGPVAQLAAPSCPAPPLQAFCSSFRRKFSSFRRKFLCEHQSMDVRPVFNGGDPRCACSCFLMSCYQRRSLARCVRIWVYCAAEGLSLTLPPPQRLIFYSPTCWASPVSPCVVLVP